MLIWFTISLIACSWPTTRRFISASRSELNSLVSSSLNLNIFLLPFTLFGAPAPSSILYRLSELFVVKLIITCPDCEENFNIRSKEEPRYCCFCGSELLIDLNDYEEEDP